MCTDKPVLRGYFVHKILYNSERHIVSFAAVFRDVTQRYPDGKVPFGGALRDIPKDGCEGDYEAQGKIGRAHV